jgi:hydroxypyruvate isomerase
MHRRTFLATASASLVLAQDLAPTSRKGRLKQSCFSRNFAPKTPLDDMCREAARIGLSGFDGVRADQWPILKKHGLVPTMAVGGGMTVENGIIQTQGVSELIKSMQAFIEVCSENGCPTLLIAGGQRRGASYTEGSARAVTFLNQLKERAEEKGVNLCLEVMNSKYENPAIGRKDQIGDHLDWVADVCTRVNSPRVKILFDLYHVQIMDGDIAANIRKAFPLIGHFHAAGVPGRHEIDETQEVNYPFIFRTIADLGYTGYIAHEYDPAPGHDPIRTLEKVFSIANV